MKVRAIFLFFLVLTIIRTQPAPAQNEAQPLRQVLSYTLISSPELEPVHTVLQNSIQALLPEAQPVYLDYQSEAAQQLITELEIKFIPYVIFSDNLALQDSFFHMVKNEMVEKNRGHYVIPDKMLRMAEVLWLGRKTLAQRIDIFVLNRCSACKEAEEKLINFIRENKLDIKLKIRYEAQFDEFGVSSTYGPEDIKDSLRQIVIQEYYPDKFWDFLLLRKDKTTAEAVAALGLSLAKLDAKKDKAMVILEQDSQEAKLLNIKLYPSFLWENIYLVPALEGLKGHEPFQDLSTK
ncbi:MAG: hypothetical protein JW714_05130 [Candidatus Omnitrophica bacterium]|nr:hypothetical protein [Candidatus Omnitrophota bacterium]